MGHFPLILNYMNTTNSETRVSLFIIYLYIVKAMYYLRLQMSSLIYFVWLFLEVMSQLMMLQGLYSLLVNTLSFNGATWLSKSLV